MEAPGFESNAANALHEIYITQLNHELEQFGGQQTAEAVNDCFAEFCHRDYEPRDTSQAQALIRDALSNEHQLTAPESEFAAEYLVERMQIRAEKLRNFAGWADAAVTTVQGDERFTDVSSLAAEATALTKDYSYRVKFEDKAGVDIALNVFKEGTARRTGDQVPEIQPDEISMVIHAETTEFDTALKVGRDQAVFQREGAELPDQLRWHTLGRNIQHEVTGVWDIRGEYVAIDDIADSMGISQYKPELRKQLNQHTSVEATSDGVVITIPTGAIGNPISAIEAGNLAATIGSRISAEAETAATESNDIQITLSGDPVRLADSTIRLNMYDPHVLAQFASEIGVVMPEQWRDETAYAEPALSRAKLMGAVAGGMEPPEQGRWR